jgi:hypothetical protein
LPPQFLLLAPFRKSLFLVVLHRAALRDYIDGIVRLTVIV